MRNPWPLVKAGTIGRKAAPRCPGAKPLDRLARRDGDWDDLVGRLDQGNVEQGGESAASAYFGTRPVIVARKSLVAIEREVTQVDIPDRLFLGGIGEINKEDRVQ